MKLQISHNCTCNEIKLRFLCRQNNITAKIKKLIGIFFESTSDGKKIFSSQEKVVKVVSIFVKHIKQVTFKNTEYSYSYRRVRKIRNSFCNK